MSSNLFPFLSNDLPEDDSDNETVTDKIPTPFSAPPSSLGQKRKSSTVTADVGRLLAPHEAGERPVKRSRAASPAPVVVDEFQTEAKREMAASGGLTGPVEEGSRLELRHQVCGGYSTSPLVLMLLRSGIKLPFLPDTTMSPSQSISLLQNPFANINSRSIHFSRFRCMQSSGMRVSWRSEEQR